MNGGAYRLFIRLPEPATIEPGKLGSRKLRAGTYVYVGSARRGLGQRVVRHRRLAESKAGNRHWHIDALLLHPGSRLLRAEIHSGADECRLSRELAEADGVSVPVPGFGATDCRSGCPAHLYKVHGRRRYPVGEGR